jgi:hypothetical protein
VPLSALPEDKGYRIHVVSNPSVASAIVGVVSNPYMKVQWRIYGNT